MRIIVGQTPSKALDQAFALVQSQLHQKENAVLLLASGNSPKGLYARLGSAVSQGIMSFSRVRFFNLDEYLDLDDTAYADSFHCFFQRELFSKIDANPKNVMLFNPLSRDLLRECDKMESAIAKHPPDMALVGIGTNGHLAFNEPGSLLNSSTRIVELAASTRRANAAAFTSRALVPHRAMTMGLGTIARAKHIVLLAFGEEKAHALHRALDEPVSTRVPASVLQRHPNVTVICDAAAARYLKSARHPMVLNNTRIFNRFNLPEKKRIVVFSPNGLDAALACGALVKALSAKNLVTLVISEMLPGHTPLSGSAQRMVESETLESARVLGIRLVLLKSADLLQKQNAVESQLQATLSRLLPDLLIIPNRLHTAVSDRFVRKIARAFVKTHAKTALWGMETPRGLFATGSWNACFEFNADLLMYKLLAIRKFKAEMALRRWDLSARHLASLRHHSASFELGADFVHPLHVGPFVQLLEIERRGELEH